MFSVCFNGYEDYDRQRFYLGRAVLSDHGSAKLYVGVLRLFFFMLVYLIDRVNRYRLRRTDTNKSRVSVILPIYYDYLSLYIIAQIVFVVLDASDDEVAKSFANITSNFVVLHFLCESLTMLLLQAGAGYKDFFYALKYGALIACIGLGVYFICALFDYYGLPVIPVLAMSLYNGALCLFYGTLLFAPPGAIFRRSAMYPYAAYMLLYNLVWLVMIIITYVDAPNSFCAVYFVYIFLDGITQPIIVYLTLIIDSQYWQGLLSFNASSPLAGLWDVNLDVATAISSFHNTSSTKMPVIYFGLIDFDHQLAFAAGGFSRVYFGKLRTEKVAIKMLFVIDLTPESINSFYEEAQILNDLRDENVVECKGITIVPPALGLVMEYCMHGSLFHFLYQGLMSAGHVVTAAKPPKQSSFWATSLMRFSSHHHHSGSSYNSGGPRPRSSSMTSIRKSITNAMTGYAGSSNNNSSSSNTSSSNVDITSSSTIANSPVRIRTHFKSTRDQESLLAAPLVGGSVSSTTHNVTSSSNTRTSSSDGVPLIDLDVASNEAILPEQEDSSGASDSKGDVNPLHTATTTTTDFLSLDSAGQDTDGAVNSSGTAGNGSTVSRNENESISGNRSLQFSNSSVDIQLMPLHSGARTSGHVHYNDASTRTAFGSSQHHIAIGMNMNTRSSSVDSTGGAARMRSRTSSGIGGVYGGGVEVSQRKNSTTTAVSDAGSTSSYSSLRSLHTAISSMSHWISDKFTRIHEPAERLSGVEHREPIYTRPGKDELADLLPYEMMLDAAKGVAFLHSKGYVHCDIKSLNFLVNEDLRVKIADLGEARPVDLDLRRKHKKADIQPRPAINWCPPEILRPSHPDEYSTASDIFSLAMVMSEILLRQIPLDEIASRLTYETWYELLLTNTRPILPDGNANFNKITENSLSSGVNPKVKVMLESAWALDPRIRPSADTMVEVLEEVVYGSIGSSIRSKARESSTASNGSTSSRGSGKLSSFISSASFKSSTSSNSSKISEKIRLQEEV